MNDALEQMLISGGDTRSAVDARTGMNRFGCTPTPRPETLNFGSSTASSISPRAFHAAQAEYDRLRSQSNPAHFLDSQMAALGQDMRGLLGLGAEAPEVVFAPSGTDATLYALFLARALHGPGPLDCVLAASQETGSGVPEALSGRHFSSATAEGVAVTPGGPIAGLADGVRLVSVGGNDAEIWAAVEASVASGRRVLLQAMAGSKLGHHAPSRECLTQIRRHFGMSVVIVADACQMRLSQARLAWHMAEGHLTLISGSKFFMGPPFSGALLVPAGLSRRMATISEVPVGLRDYASRSAWPAAWVGLRDTLPERVLAGQYLRWVAAREEMRAYFAVPADFRCQVLHRFAALAAEQFAERAAELHLLEDAPRAWDEADGEMNARTLFPFLVRRGAGWLSLPDAVVLHRALNLPLFSLLPSPLAAQPCHLGQPVAVSWDGQTRVGALRLCAGARTVSELWACYQTDRRALQMERERREIGVALDKTVLLVRQFSSLSESGSLGSITGHVHSSHHGSCQTGETVVRRSRPGTAVAATDSAFRHA